MGNCKDCAHWHTAHTGEQICLRPSRSDDEEKRFMLSSLDFTRASMFLVTGPEFGCVLHESK